MLAKQNRLVPIGKLVLAKQKRFVPRGKLVLAKQNGVCASSEWVFTNK